MAQPLIRVPIAVLTLALLIPSLAAGQDTIDFMDENGDPTTEVVESDWARVRVSSPAANALPAVAETVDVDLSTLYAGDFEIVTLTETDVDTGVFEGAIRVAGSPGSGPGFLDTATSGPPDYFPEEITADYLGLITTAEVIGSRTFFIDAWGRVVTSYALGERIYVRVFDQNLNDALAVDSLVETVTAPGDSEDIVLTETSYDTGVFEGSIPTGPGYSSNDGQLFADLAETVSVIHLNFNGGQSSATATMTTSAVYFLDAAGQIATVYLQSSAAILRAIDVYAAASPFSPDTTWVDLTAALSGDSENLMLTETGDDTWVFEGTIPLSVDPATSWNGVLETTEVDAPHQDDTLTATYNDAGGGSSSTTATTRGSDTWFIDAYGSVTSVYATGSTVYVRVEDHNFNTDGVFDTVDVTVSSLATGDSEPLTLWETGKSTAIYEGSLPLEDGGPASPSDGLLQASGGETIEAVHLDWFGFTQSWARATLTVATIEFIDADGLSTPEIVESDWAWVRVVSPNFNADPFTAETLWVDLTTLYAADFETLELTETGEDTGVFEGAIRVAGSPGSGPGLLDVMSSGPPLNLPEQVTADLFGITTTTAEVVGSRASFIDAWGRVVSSYAFGDRIYVRIFDQNLNDALAVDSLIETVVAPGDSETITLTETGYDTGTFEGWIQTGPGFAPDDGVLWADIGETVSITHLNFNGGESSATATMTGGAVFFLDAAGQIATVYLQNTAAVVRVIDYFANVDPGAPDTLWVDLTAALSGDFETLMLTETGDETLVFEGTIPLSVDPASPSDGILQTAEVLGPPHEDDVLTATYNAVYGGSSTTTATTRGSYTWFIDAFGAVTSVYATGSTVYVRVEDHNSNTDGVFDTVDVTVSSLATGDSEPLTLWETGKSTAIYEGSLPIEDGGGPSPADGWLQAFGGETIEAVHLDWFGFTQSWARATLTVATIEFIDADGLPTPEIVESDWARVRVVSPNFNADPFTAETLWVDLTTLYAADFETLELTETGEDTGVFEGAIRVAGSPGSGPGLLDVMSSGPPLNLPEQVTADLFGITTTAEVVGSRASFIDAWGRVVSNYAFGDRIYVRIFDQNLNDALAVDSLIETVVAPGDSETITLTETGYDTGTFEGWIQTGPGFAPDDGLFWADIGETVSITHLNFNGGQSSATATMTGGAVFFLDAAGQIVTAYLQSSAAIVRVIDYFANVDPGSPDTVWVDLTAALSGDFETLMLTETGNATLVFEGTIPLSVDPASSWDGTLQTAEALGPPHQNDLLTATYNAVYGGSSSTTATTRASDTWFIDAYGAVTSVYAEGSTVYVRVEDHNFNTDGVFDTVDVTVSSLGTGDSEPLTLWETGKSTAIYEGSLALEAGGGSPGDGRLQSFEGETIEAVHLDWFGFTQSSARATLTIATIEFIDAGGEPTTEIVESDWARVRMVSPRFNVDQGTAEILWADLTTLYALDLEPLELTETGQDTGIFEGAIRVAGSPGSGPGFLDVMSSGPPLNLPEQVTVDYFGITATAEVIGSRTFFIDAWGREVSSYAFGERIYVRVFDQNLNDALAVDSLIETVVAPADSETITLTETGEDTGIFEGWIQTGLGFAPGDGLLHADLGETVSVTHLNFNGGQSSATATITGSAVYFVDAAGQIATVYLQGSEAIVRVIDLDANGSAGSPDTTWVDLTAALSGDFETLMLTETGDDTGVFEGTIPLSVDPASPSNGVLETTEAPGPPHEDDVLTATYNDAWGGTSYATATTVGSYTWFIDAYGGVASVYATGTEVYVRVEDHNFNNEGVVDTVDVTLSSLTTGDSEPLTLAETGASTGIYEGSLPLEDSASPSLSDGLLQVQVDEQIEVVHLDWLGFTQSSARATIEATAIEFIDENGVPTDEVVEGDWARLRLYSALDNFQSDAVDFVSITVTTLNAGDIEWVDLFETGVDTGIFEGAIRLAGPAGAGPGFLDWMVNGAPYEPEQITATTFDGQSAVAHTVGSRVEFINAFGAVVSTFAAGDRVYVRILDQNLNDELVVDSLFVTVDAPASGDVETTTLTETGAETGVFEGSVQLGSGPFPEDGLLQADVGETVSVTHLNGNGTSTSATATISGSATWFIDAQGQPASSYMEGSEAIVRVIDHPAAVDPGSVETVAVTLTAELSGDQETLTLTETGVATGVFEGTIALSIDPASSFNGVLETSEDPGPPLRFDTLLASYTDAGGGNSSATATTSGSLTWFIDAYGAVTDIFAYNSTAYVRVEDQNFNQPGEVDSVTATITDTGNLDTETMTLTEVDAASGIFEGTIDLEFGPVVPGDGILQAANNHDIEAVHDNALGFSQSSAQATVVQGTVWWIDDAGLPVSELEENGVGRVRVLSPLENFNPTVVNTSNVEIMTVWSGDNELVTLLETGPDTGVFEGTIDLDFVPLMGGGIPGNGIIETTHNGAPEYRPEQVTARTALTYTAVATVVPSRLSFVDLLSQPVSAYALGATVRVQVVDHNLNLDPGIVDTFVVPVVSQLTGDVEDVTVSELGPDSGVFEESLATTDLVTGLQDGTLSVQVGETIEVTHFNANVPTVNSAQATIDGNLPPLAVDDAAATLPDQAVVIDVLANDSDPELGALVVAGVTQGGNGAVVINGDDTVTYTPNPAFVGIDVFTYVVEDAGGGQSQATVTVAINSCSANRSLVAGQWALISAPCDPGAAGTVADLFGDDLPVADYGNRWAVYAYNAFGQRYHMLALTSSLGIGKGYWIKTVDAGQSIDIAGDTTEVVTVSLVADAVSGRSNLVGHPFLFDVCWADVEVVDGGSVLTLDQADPVVGVERACSMEPPDPSCVMSRVAYRWTGAAYASFDGVTPGAEGTLSSFQGLWVKAFKAGIGLRIPALESASCSGGKSAGVPLKSSEGEWFVHLSAESGALRDDSAVLGQLATSADGYDRHDLPKLAAEEDRDFLAIVFPRPGWGTGAGDYATDFHAVKAAGQADAWEFEVRSSAPGLEVTLRWQGPEWALAGARLIDEVSGRTVAVEPDGSYTFRMRGSRHPLRWQLR